jgi:hypothetical protein
VPHLVPEAEEIREEIERGWILCAISMLHAAKFARYLPCTSRRLPLSVALVIEVVTREI